MAKKYNILNDKVEIKKILEELGHFCVSHDKCTYCPFFDNYVDNCKFETSDKLIPADYFDFIGDDDE